MQDPEVHPCQMVAVITLHNTSDLALDKSDRQMKRANWEWHRVVLLFGTNWQEVAGEIRKGFSGLYPRSAAYP